MKITISKLSTKDLATLSQRIITNFQSGKYPVISNHPLTATLQTSYADFDRVYTKETYSGKGTDVATADGERDKAFAAIKNYLDGYRKLPLMANFQVAEELYQIFVKYGLDLDRLTYSSQTAQMKKLIEELELAENVQKISTLSLTPAFADMKTKHEAFEDLFEEQAEANGELRNMTSASAIRRDLETKVKSYLNLLTSMQDVAGWDLLYHDVNELVKAAKNSDHKPGDKPEI